MVKNNKKHFSLPATSRKKCRKKNNQRRLETLCRFRGASRSHTDANTETPAAVFANFYQSAERNGAGENQILPPAADTHSTPAEGRMSLPVFAFIIKEWSHAQTTLRREGMKAAPHFPHDSDSSLIVGSRFCSDSTEYLCVQNNKKNLLVNK